MSPYREKFLLGSLVQIAGEELLLQFMRNSKFHHKMTDEQLHYAARTAQVAKVSFHHDGDVFYQLSGVPGTWHERCLSAVHEP